MKLWLVVVGFGTTTDRSLLVADPAQPGMHFLCCSRGGATPPPSLPLSHLGVIQHKEPSLSSMTMQEDDPEWIKTLSEVF